jgi:hypothetical protein
MALRKFIAEKELDVLGVNETNNYWKSLPADQRLHERTRGWFGKIHVNYSYYEEFKESGVYQAGGTAIFSINQAADRVMGAGKDINLGQWSWTRYRGKQGIAVRIYTVYTPTNNKRDLGSTYNQHLDYFHEHGQERDPRKAIIDDLCKEIEIAMKEGDQIVVILDANEDIRKGYAQEQFNRLGLSESVIDRHGQQAPNTYIDGSDPIDGIFVSPTLRGCKCGYAAFGDGPPGITHRLVWIDIPVSQAFGNVMQSRKFTARKLQNYDPRITAKYLKVYKKFLKSHKLDEKLEKLQEKIQQDGLTDDLIEEWHAIDTLRRKGMASAERKCRKFKVGKVPWSPEIAKVMMVKLAWSLILPKLKGCKIGKKYLKRTLHLADMKWEDRLVTVEVAEQAHKNAIKSFRIAARTAAEARTSWLDRLTAAIGKKQCKEKATVLKELKTREKQRDTA